MGTLSIERSLPIAISDDRQGHPARRWLLTT